MKKFLLLFMAFAALSGCSQDDDSADSFLRIFVPVISAEFPKTFTAGQEYTIKVRYSPPTRCHEFDGMDYEIDENEIYIGVANSFSPNDPSCNEEEGLTAETSFSFTPETNDFYIFNFWRGQDEEGEPLFLTIKVPVEPVASENEV